MDRILITSFIFIFPKSYYVRSKIKSGSFSNQIGCCWAYSTIELLEAFLLKESQHTGQGTLNRSVIYMAQCRLLKQHLESHCRTPLNSHSNHLFAVFKRETMLAPSRVTGGAGDSHVPFNVAVRWHAVCTMMYDDTRIHETDEIQRMKNLAEEFHQNAPKLIIKDPTSLNAVPDRVPCANVGCCLLQIRKMTRAQRGRIISGLRLSTNSALKSDCLVL